jgi:hypothetical protein
MEEAGSASFNISVSRDGYLFLKAFGGFVISFKRVWNGNNRLFMAVFMAA